MQCKTNLLWFQDSDSQLKQNLKVQRKEMKNVYPVSPHQINYLEFLKKKKNFILFYFYFRNCSSLNYPFNRLIEASARSPAGNLVVSIRKGKKSPEASRGW